MDDKTLQGNFNEIFALLQQGQAPKSAPFPSFPGDVGIATSGSSTTLVDTSKSWGNNVFANALLMVKIGSVVYQATITSNSGNQLNFVAITDANGNAVSVGANSQYRIYNIWTNFGSQSIGVAGRPDYAVLQGNEKNFQFFNDTPVAYGTNVNTSYTVPSGKTLYIVSFTGWILPDVAANSDGTLLIYFYIQNDITGDSPISLSGLGGLSGLLPQPIAIPGGQQITMGVTNYTNHSCSLGGVVNAYEE